MTAKREGQVNKPNQTRKKQFMIQTNNHKPPSLRTGPRRQT